MEPGIDPWETPKVIFNFSKVEFKKSNYCFQSLKKFITNSDLFGVLLHLN